MKILIALGAIVLWVASVAVAGTTVPGHAKYDADGNGYPDDGVYVNGHYTSMYAVDGNGDYYQDLGDGRVYKTVDSVDDLDQATMVYYSYVNNYRADFGNDPYMDRGWIQNHIVGHGPDGTSHYNYLIVHASDPRYTGNPEWTIWGDWEYHVLSVSGSGNLVKHLPHPQNHVGN